MGTWIVNNKASEKETYQDFETAVKRFRNIIANFFWDFSYEGPEDKKTLNVFGLCGVPDQIGAYFSYKYDERTITDEEIVIDQRLEMLLDFLKCQDTKDLKENTLKVIKKPIHYHGEIEEFEQTVDINVDLLKDEVVVSLESDGDYLKTNAFIFDNQDKTYYFDCSATCHTSTKEEDLGKVVFLDITLTKVE